MNKACDVQGARTTFIAQYLEQHADGDRKTAQQAWLASTKRQQLIDAMGHAEAKRRKLI